ncbi:heat shock protein GrpE [Metamycoplasma arthritidis]|uniref:Protein GrpE n=1 Tax=Metamycoplasma arthritidis (strain 158L3-1) TaxID=243272 RepID=B3PN02_META1|nr:nucleotide exchange factor GrpE [Metamycoplasma arthritidis]ACF07404.1 heat shock protein GrpE [Metamycoplasma arthritidis 158L3-1]VEU78926.1 heat shock protein GrpE [Metamycoplasma arthritidis]
MKIIRKYDYVEMQIVEFEGKKRTKNFPEENIKMYLGTDDSFDSRVTKFLIGQTLVLNSKLIYVNPENKKNTIEIEIFKHSSTPQRYVNLMIELQYLNNQIATRNKKINLLEEAIATKENKISTLESDFKKQISDLQIKAQQVINEHRKKNDEHFNNQRIEEQKYALQEFLESLLQPLNNFELAIKSAHTIENDVVQNFVKGFDMLYSQIEQVLSEVGISKIEPKIDDLFDPTLHQIYEVKTSEKPVDTILEVKNIGYRLHDRTIKPALVVVSGNDVN